MTANFKRSRVWASAFASFARCLSGFILTFTGLLVILAGCKDDAGNNPAIRSGKDSAEIYRRVTSTPDNCKSCHPRHFEEWEQSMHAYTMKDPIFFVLDSIGQARSGGKLGQFCLECHSPTSVVVDNMPNTSAHDKMSAFSAHGISCDICHMLAPDQPRRSNTTRLAIDGARRGPISDPVANSFHTSLYDSRYDQSQACKNCHNEYTPTGFFLEKTYSEWENSPFPGRAISCQTCHMKTYKGAVATGGPEREQAHGHRMVGVDVPIADFPGREETIAEIKEMLNYSVKMDVMMAESVNQSAKSIPIKVRIMNVLTGHNIPSGAIFGRQMWLEVIAISDKGDTLLTSGLLDSKGDLLDNNSDDVKSGKAKLDANLALYTGAAYQHGSPTPFPWEADYVENRTIPSFDSRTNFYVIPMPQNSNAKINVSVRLRFRALPPYFLRLIGRPQFVERVPIFEMEQFTGAIAVQ